MRREVRAERCSRQGTQLIKMQLATTHTEQHQHTSSIAAAVVCYPHSALKIQKHAVCRGGSPTDPARPS